MVSPDEPAAAGGAHASRGGETPDSGSAGQTPPSGPAHGGLRIGDRERDEVTRLLHDAFAQGRITREELDERLDATLSARRAEDLRRVTADLPGAWQGDAWTGGAPGGTWGGRRAGDARAGGPWHPGFPSAGVPGFPGSPVSAHPGPYGPGGPFRPVGGPNWAHGNWAHGNWGHGMVPRRHGRRPHPAVFLIPVAAVVFLAAGPMWPPFLVFKLLLVALLVKAVLGLGHHRRHHRHHTRH
ncbi:DUF1707 domain-containing protein [Microbispora sp. NPDC046973]|uniref:DUF1707 SHOCT-like domain-containing protein n=1 Tax=Microbispora sp. NPDC046973 TaxID=3155022 RepID=UPI0033DF41F3